MKNDQEIIRQQFQLARELKDAWVDQILALNNDKHYRQNVVCYGFAIGVTPEEVSTQERSIYFGDLSSKFRTTEFNRWVPGDTYHHYRMIVDGHVPLATAEAMDAASDRQIVVGIEDHILRRVGHVWMHKPSKTPITLSYGTQPVITDILKAISEYQDASLQRGHASSFWGFYEVTPNRARLGSTIPPDYGEHSVERLARLFQSINYAQTSFWEPKGLARMLSEMDKFDQAVVAEITSLGLQDHPRMERTLRQTKSGIWKKVRKDCYQG